MNELDRFIEVWNYEADRSAKIMESLPANQYDFRPDAGGRSLGELAWHLAEIDGYIADGIAKGKVDFAPVAGLTRPREIAALAPGYRRVHDEALARLRAAKVEDLDKSIPFANRQISIRDLLWGATLHHAIHHRGQLCLMNRIAGGETPGIYGPNREQTAAMRQQA